MILGSAQEVGKYIKESNERVHARRRKTGQAYYFNWELHIQPALQEPFHPTHEAMSGLQLTGDIPKHILASELRRAFSGLVAGNVKPFGIEQVELHGPYKLSGDGAYLASIDRLLRILVKEGRMKLGEGEHEYQPCYELQG